MDNYEEQEKEMIECLYRYFFCLTPKPTKTQSSITVTKLNNGNIPKNTLKEVTNGESEKKTLSPAKSPTKQKKRIIIIDNDDDEEEEEGENLKVSVILFFKN
jgi:hypothetical protein